MSGAPVTPWCVGAMNDGLFIINRAPSPSGTDEGPWQKEGGPTVVLNVASLTLGQARQIADAHNADLAALRASHAEMLAALRSMLVLYGTPGAVSERARTAIANAEALS